MEYNFKDIEQKWQTVWRKRQTYKVDIDTNREKYYVLDMFPYPSGAGLHVGHPLGYIASDIVARYKKLRGFNVLHPMGFDAFGLPAEQYAIQTGQHPKVTTEENINRYKEQLDQLGFGYDWDREIRTCEPDYYKWTQWIFIQLFHSWFNYQTQSAEPIESLIKTFESEGLICIQPMYLTGDIEEEIGSFTAEDWKSFSSKKQSDILLKFRLAYLSEAWVNWCPALGTVLANDEVKDGVSERGGHPVERKQMPQWSLRITAYADRLLSGLDDLDWTDSIKEAQRNWIGKSEGTSILFQLENSSEKIEVFTTRPDTIFGVSFVTLAPEHELVSKITTAEYKNAVDNYITVATNRSERERQADVKRISGQFTGSFVIHPFSGAKIPVWIGDYVLVGYGTGAVMAVPAHDSRDHAFAKHFSNELSQQLGRNPLMQVVEVPTNAEHTGIENESYDDKNGVVINSDFLNGLDVKDAIKKAIVEIGAKGLGKKRTNYRLRDAAFGRQRYWGEPIPVYYNDGIPQTLDESELPLILPEIDKFQPTEAGDPPLARAKDWKYKGKYEYEHTTMPGWAGSSWYFLRYMDAKNENVFADKDKVNYWKQVDFYLGGAEHSTGHLLYVRFWTKFLFDRGYIPVDEPAKKLINQGMIQGVSAFVWRARIQLISTDPNSNDSNNEYIFINASNLIRSKTKLEVLISNSIVLQYKEWLKFKELNFERVFFYDFESWYNQTEDGKIILEFIESLKDELLSNSLYSKYFTFYVDIESSPLRIDISYLDDEYSLNIEKAKLNRNFTNSTFIQDGEKFFVTREVEKMSKSKFNVVNPDDIINDYGADTLRLYEMFLGPLEQSKPWSTQGISGVHNFLRRLWRLTHDAENKIIQNKEAASQEELKVLHKTIKKVEEDVERFSFNTTISSFMICVNELTDLKCNKREIIEPLLIILSPYAPHFTEEIWEQLGHTESITSCKFPQWNEEFLKENNFDYPISINGKVKFKMNLSLQLTKEEIEETVMKSEELKKHIQQAPKKFIVVPGRIVNIVL
jgi:leucyl-tRNA synthetase